MITAQEIEHLYPLTNVQNLEVIKDTLGVRQVGRFTSDQGEYIYKIIEGESKTDRLGHILKTINNISKEEKVRLPEIVQNTQKEFLSNWDGVYLYVITYVSGKNPIHQRSRIKN